MLCLYRTENVFRSTHIARSSLTRANPRFDIGL